MVADVRGKLSGQFNRRASTDFSSGSRSTQSFVYSQGYYLYEVRRVLREREAITTVTASSDVAGVASGDFVEFRATFRPNEIHALLDILTPDLVAAITEHQVKALAIAGAEEEVWLDFPRREAFLSKTTAQAEVKANLARAVAEAIRVDFRSQQTREFYGQIGPDHGGVTAITICDNAHFVIDDEDRILDGQFTVLGKVTGPVTEDLPVFDRNKLLDRLNPDAVDIIFDEFRDVVSHQVLQFEGRLAKTTKLKTASDVMNLALASRIKGPSFKVIPIAIYV